MHETDEPQAPKQQDGRAFPTVMGTQSIDDWSMFGSSGCASHLPLGSVIRGNEEADPRGTHLNGSRASSVTTQGDMVVAKFLPLNGPSGTASHFWMSRALQSFMMTMPKTWSSAFLMGMLDPCSLPGPMKHAWPYADG